VQYIPCNRANILPYLSLIEPEQAHALVLFQAASLEHALLRCDLLNTLRAQSRRLSSEPTGLLLTTPLASDLSYHAWTPWRNPRSSPCPPLSDRACHAQPPARARHVPAEQRASDPSLIKSPGLLSISHRHLLPLILQAHPSLTPLALTVFYSGQRTDHLPIARQM
jgi:hypothetical protein